MRDGASGRLVRPVPLAVSAPCNAETSFVFPLVHCTPTLPSMSKQRPSGEKSVERTEDRSIGPRGLKYAHTERDRRGGRGWERECEKWQKWEKCEKSKVAHVGSRIAVQIRFTLVV